MATAGRHGKPVILELGPKKLASLAAPAGPPPEEEPHNLYEVVTDRPQYSPYSNVKQKKVVRPQFVKSFGAYESRPGMSSIAQRPTTSEEEYILSSRPEVPFPSLTMDHVSQALVQEEVLDSRKKSPHQVVYETVEATTFRPQVEYVPYQGKLFTVEQTQSSYFPQEESRKPQVIYETVAVGSQSQSQQLQSMAPPEPVSIPASIEFVEVVKPSNEGGFQVESAVKQ
jgi:hypothetical protein